MKIIQKHLFSSASRTSSRERRIKAIVLIKWMLQFLNWFEVKKQIKLWDLLRSNHFSEKEILWWGNVAFGFWWNSITTKSICKQSMNALGEFYFKSFWFYFLFSFSPLRFLFFILIFCYFPRLCWRNGKDFGASPIVSNGVHCHKAFIIITQIKLLA